jgi:hypothetical protein
VTTPPASDDIRAEAERLGGNAGNAWQIPAFMAMIVVVGLVVYYGAKTLRRGQGIDADLVYRELPPE